MSSSVGPASERAAGLLEGYFAWRQSDRSAQIYIHPDVVDTLSAEATKAAQHGREIGGVLWGKAGPANSLIVLDAKLVESTGPLFNATGTDARILQQVLTGRAPTAALSLAGYFRSSLREGQFVLTPQDQTVIRQCVSDPDAIFLVIQPGDNGTCKVGLSFWHDGALRTEPGDSDVPFVAANEQAPVPAATAFEENRTATREETLRASLGRPHPEPRTSSASQQESAIVDMLRQSAMRQHPAGAAAAPAPQPEPKPEKSPKTSNATFLLLAFALICFIAVIGVAGVYFGLPALPAHLWGGSDQHRKPGLDVRVARGADGQLTLDWNGNAPQITSVTTAVVTIRDGHRTKRVNLDNAHLRSGKLPFRPKSADVQFQIQVNAGKLHMITESVRVRSPARRAGLARRAQNGTALSQTQNGLLDEESAPGGQDGTTVVEVVVPDESDRISVSVPSSAPGGVTGPMSGGPAPSAAYVPPQVVEEMMPESAPRGPFARLTVQVSIDTRGYVTAAEILKDGEAANDTLTAAAMAAARGWHFRPALLNGKPVPSEYRIVFAFRQKIPE